VHRRYLGCALVGRLLEFSLYNPQRGLLAGHPEYIILVPSYTFNHFTCICEAFVITSIHIALPLLALRVTVLSCWSALTVSAEDFP
jgi:hypothetical protein